MAVELVNAAPKRKTFDLYACVLVRNVFQRYADFMRIKLGSRLKKGIQKCIQVVFFNKNPTEKPADVYKCRT